MVERIVCKGVKRSRRVTRFNISNPAPVIVAVNLKKVNLKKANFFSILLCVVLCNSVEFGGVFND